MKRADEKYIGDGVYARCDGFGIWLRAPRETGDHEVYLEPEVWEELLRYGRDAGLPHLVKDPPQ